jgi:hypothetical protein
MLAGDVRMTSYGLNVQDFGIPTFHLCCASHEYERGQRYVGFVLYALNGATRFNLGGRRCRGGYVVILDSSTSMPPSNQGQVRMGEPRDKPPALRSTGGALLWCFLHAGKALACSSPR